MVQVLMHTFYTLLASRLFDDKAETDCINKNWSSLTVEENKENKVNIHKKLFFSKKNVMHTMSTSVVKAE